MYRRTGAAAATACLAWGTGAILLLSAGGALASDYSHECRTADGRYEINDGMLVAANDTSRRSIAYETVKESVLAHKRGYCVANGNKYEFESKTYVLSLRFLGEDGPLQIDALCELASDGLPAAYKCEREVVTLDTKSGQSVVPPPTPNASVWDHNGSRMRLESSGSDRRFVYEQPRRGMRDAGAAPGDSVFEGRREGRTYAGTAYIFSKTCGKIAYQVAGNISEDERQVVLEGQVPSLIAKSDPTSATSSFSNSSPAEPICVALTYWTAPTWERSRHSAAACSALARSALESLATMSSRGLSSMPPAFATRRHLAASTVLFSTPPTPSR